MLMNSCPGFGNWTAHHQGIVHMFGSAIERKVRVYIRRKGRLAQTCIPMSAFSGCRDLGLVLNPAASYGAGSAESPQLRLCGS